MHNNAQTTRRNIFYSLLILAVTLGFVAALVLFILSLPGNQQAMFFEHIEQAFRRSRDGTP